MKNLSFKKKFCAIVIFLLILFPKEYSFSQFLDRFGVNLILSASKQNIEGNDLNTSNFYGTGIGVFYEFYCTRIITTSLNLEYIQRGTEVDFGITSIPESINEIKECNRIDYLSLPVTARILLLKSEINLYLLLGIRTAYNISYDSDYLVQYFSNANKFTFGGITGFGFEFKLNKYLSLLPSLIYNFDFNNAINYSYYTGELKFKNSSIDFSLGIKITE